MKHYDEYGRRVPRSRSDSYRPRSLDVVTVLLAFAAVVSLVAWMLKAKEYSELQKRSVKSEDHYGLTARDSMAAIKTEQGEVIRLYVITDPDDGTEYVVSDKGGICVRGHADAE